MALPNDFINISSWESNFSIYLRFLGSDQILDCLSLVVAAVKVIALDKKEYEPLIVERFPAWVTTVEYWDIGDADVMFSPIAIKLFL